MATKKSLRSRSRSRSRSRTRAKSPAVRFIAARAAGPPRPKKNKKGKNKAPAQLHLSDCATEYAHCLLNPCGGVPSCLPSVGACHSRKVKYFARGAFATSSTNGIGFVMFAPGQGIVSDQIFTVVTTAASTATALATGGTGIAPLFSNSDYVAAQIGVGKLNYRLVSACIRIRYTGTVLNKAGSVYSLMEPDHQSLVGAGIPQLRAYASCTDTPVTQEWTEIIYGGPTMPNEMDYVMDYTSAAYNNNFMGIMVNSPTGVSLSFDVESWVNFEIIGPNVGGKTPSMADPQGLSLVTNGVQSAIAVGQAGHHGGESFLTKAIHGIGTAAKKAMTFIGPAVQGMGGVEGIMKKALPMLTKRALPALAMAL